MAYSKLLNAASRVPRDAYRALARNPAPVLALAVVAALAALWAWRRHERCEREPRAWGGYEGARDVAEHMNILTEQWIKGHWSRLVAKYGFDKPVSWYLKTFGRGNQTYGCNRNDAGGSVKNFQLCKRWSQLNNTTHATLMQISQGQTNARTFGCNTDGLGPGQEKYISEYNGQCIQARPGRNVISFPKCKCAEGAYKAANGAHICGGRGCCSGHSCGG